MGSLKPYYGKSNFYQNKKRKALSKIEKLQRIVKACDVEIEKIALGF